MLKDSLRISTTSKEPKILKELTSWFRGASLCHLATEDLGVEAEAMEVMGEAIQEVAVDMGIVAIEEETATGEAPTIMVEDTLVKVKDDGTQSHPEETTGMKENMTEATLEVGPVEALAGTKMEVHLDSTALKTLSMISERDSIKPLLVRLKMKVRLILNSPLSHRLQVNLLRAIQFTSQT